MYKVSVVIPTYKRPHWLSRAIESVLNQTYQNIEVVVVDDNDEDSLYRAETVDLMSKYLSDSRVIYIKNNNNQGGAFSRNIGVNSSNGNYITFLDDDDYYEITKIEKQSHFYEEKSKQHPKLGFVYCQMSVFVNKKLTRKTENFFDGHKIPYLKNLEGCIAGTPTIFMKKELFNEVGGFKNLKSGQDWNLVQEILSLGYEVYSMRDSLINVYEHDLQRISNSAGKLDSLKNEIYNLKKQYLNVDFISNNESNKILFSHYYQLASAAKFVNKIQSIKFMLKANYYFFSIKHNFKFFISIIVGKSFLNIFRRFF